MIVNLLAAASTINELIQDMYSLLWGWMLAAVLSGAGVMGLIILIKYALAGGEPEKIKKVNGMVKYIVIGIIVFALIMSGLPLVIAAVMNI